MALAWLRNLAPAGKGTNFPPNTPYGPHTPSHPPSKVSRTQIINRETRFVVPLLQIWPNDQVMSNCCHQNCMDLNSTKTEPSGLGAVRFPDGYRKADRLSDGTSSRPQ